MIIYLDMDGVVCDFSGRVLQLYGKNPKAPIDNYWALPEACGVVDEEMWSRIRKYGHTFWAGLDKLPWADDLVDSLTSFSEEVYFVTSPTVDPNSAKGKLQWIEKNYPDFYQDRKYKLMAHKHHLADPNSLLIDDRPSNVDLFRKEDGYAILFPRYYNGHRSDPNTLVSNLLESIKRMVP